MMAEQESDQGIENQGKEQQESTNPTTDVISRSKPEPVSERTYRNKNGGTYQKDRPEQPGRGINGSKEGEVVCNPHPCPEECQNARR